MVLPDPNASMLTVCNPKTSFALRHSYIVLGTSRALDEQRALSNAYPERLDADRWQLRKHSRKSDFKRCLKGVCHSFVYMIYTWQRVFFPGSGLAPVFKSMRCVTTRARGRTSYSSHAYTITTIKVVLPKTRQNDKKGELFPVGLFKLPKIPRFQIWPRGQAYLGFNCRTWTGHVDKQSLCFQHEPV